MINRFARIALALTVTSAIGMQIPTRNGVALAQNGYGGSSSSGGKIFGVKGESIVAGAGAYIALVLLTKKAKDLPENFTPSFGFSTTPPILTEPGKSYVPPMTGTSDDTGSSNAASASLLDVSGGKARDLIDRCPSLSKQLQNEGPFTMFLPNDEVLSSVKLDGAKLEAFLKRHIVLGRYSYEDLSLLSDGAKLQTLAETELAVTHGDDSSVLVGGALIPNDAHAGSNGFSYTIKNIFP